MANGERDLAADEFERKCCDRIGKHSGNGGILLLTASVVSVAAMLGGPLVLKANPYRNLPEVISYVKLRDGIESLKSERREMLEKGIYNNVSLDEGIKHEQERMDGASSVEDVQRYEEWNSCKRNYCMNVAIGGGIAVTNIMLAPAIGAFAVPWGYRRYRTVRRTVRNFIQRKKR